MAVDYTTHDGVAVITLNNPPVNGLGLSTRAGIVEGIERAQNDPAIKAIVLTGAGKAFSGGADITEFNTPKATQEPTLAYGHQDRRRAAPSRLSPRFTASPWAAASNWRSARITGSPRPARRSRCRK